MAADSPLVSQVQKVRLAAIEPNPDNPRGTFEKDSSFSRLVDSIKKVGVLVPIVVMQLRHPKAEARYRLLDGERRYWACKELAFERVPAHVIQHEVSSSELRKLMFHLHMTREQWGALAQCRALAEAYKPLDRGLTFNEKPAWEKQIAADLNMSKRTARDRVHFLAWPRDLKEEVYDFNARDPRTDIYSYVLAIEASIIVPSLRAFPDLYNHGKSPEHFANLVRKALLNKTIYGLERGLVVRREQIREVEPLFEHSLPGRQYQAATSIFKRLIGESGYLYQDARTDIEIRLPQLLRERPPKPRRMLASIRALTRTLNAYRPEYLDSESDEEPSRTRLGKTLLNALTELASAINSLKAKLS